MDIVYFMFNSDWWVKRGKQIIPKQTKKRLDQTQDLN